MHRCFIRAQNGSAYSEGIPTGLLGCICGPGESVWHSHWGYSYENPLPLWHAKFPHWRHQLWRPWSTRRLKGQKWETRRRRRSSVICSHHMRLREDIGSPCVLECLRTTFENRRWLQSASLVTTCPREERRYHQSYFKISFIESRRIHVPQNVVFSCKY